MSSKTVFISYTHTDEEWAKLIGSELEEMGHKVISMYKVFQDNFLSRIKEAYDECDDIILVFSPRYEESGYCEHERTVALKQIIEETRRRNSVHLVKVDPYKMHEFYSVYTYIDLSPYALGSPEVKSYFRSEIGKRFGSPDQKPYRYTIHNLPLRIPNFTGRTQIINSVHDEFFSGKVEKNIQVLAGLGGVGKTKVSLEYAYRYLDQYTLIWFFHAEDPSQLRQEISRLVKTLKLPEWQSESTDHHLSALKRYLDNRDKWLLIFDNAEAPSDISGILPSVPRGHILITSRNPGWGSIACVHSLDNFSKEESVGFLKKRLNRSNEIPCLEDVSDKLAYFPLALNSAAAYMETNQITCDDYKTILQETKDLLIKMKTEGNLPLMSVWSLSLDKIRNKSPQSIWLLEYLSNFSPDEIPEDVLYPILQNTSELSEHVKHRADYYRILSHLLKYSFVTKNMKNKTLNLHRLVQDSIQFKMDTERKKQQVAELVLVFSQQFPIKSTDPETIDSRMWQKCRYLLPHAIKVAGLAENFKVAPEPTLHLYAQIASFLRELNNLKDAVENANRALAIIDRSKNTESLHHAVCLETRARILRDLGRNNEAQDLMIHAIRIEENYFNRNSIGQNDTYPMIDKSHLAVCYDGYGRILSNLDQAEKALEYYNKALQLDLRTDGENDPKIAIRKNNIGLAYGRLGNDDLEIKYLKEALAIEERYYSNKGDDKHPHIAIRLNNLALEYEKTRDRDPSGTNLDLALQYWERSFDINHGFYGLGNPHTLSSMYGLAGHHCIRKDFEKALEWNNKAIEITLSEDPDSFNYGMSLLHRGNSHFEMKNYSLALRDYESALDIITKLRGEENYDRSIILKNISHLHSMQQNYTSAADYLKQALKIDEVSKKRKDREYCINLCILGYYYSQTGDQEQAKTWLEQALQELELEGGIMNQDYLIALGIYINTKIATKDTRNISELIKKYESIKSTLNK